MDHTSLGIDEIFQAALGKNASELKAYLNHACNGDSQLRARVERLLKAHAIATDGFLDSPPTGLGAREVDEIPATIAHTAEQLGGQIGPYKLLQKLGEGGMGSVYMAEQKKPVARRVALKIIKPGMDSGQVIARFEAERQALAMMDHPNIAKVFDAGATSLGRPYFVMELVKGVPITQYCDENHLTTKQRLGLFVDVCNAVQHAHQKGIIHRDLKPQNVLVADYDHKPVPKVIDFGIAKAITQSLTEKTIFTEIGQVVGTLEYMSPEQAKLNQLDVDTRTDIYSLGVMLYQLLTGVTPIEPKRLRSAGFEEMLRIIREEEPPKPSTRISSWGASSKSFSDSRRTTMHSLKKMVQGDLDWIVMKAIEKDRARRYDTANAFADDVQRYLSDELVSARPPSAIYRTSKFVRRNKGTLISAAAVIFLVGLAALGIRTLAERDSKAEAAKLLVEQVLEASQDSIDEHLGKLESNLYGAKATLLNWAEKNDKNSKESLNAQLALVQNGDSTYVKPLVESLLTETAGYVAVILKVLEPHKDMIENQLWSVLKSNDQNENGLRRRFRAALALAEYSADSSQWDGQYDFIANQILLERPIDQEIYLGLVRPIAKSCIPHWKSIFVGDDVFLQVSAAYALEYFAGDQLLPQKEIAELLAEASPKQFQILFPLIEDRDDKNLIAQLQKIAATPPSEHMGTEDRVIAGKARAGGGIALLRLGQLQSALDMFIMESDLNNQNGSNDPEAIAQFIHRCKERGVTVKEVHDCLQLLESPNKSSAFSNDAARYALLLALAEYPVDEVPPKLLEELVTKAGDWYRNDPRSSVHGATRWLLQSWNRKDLIDRVDQTETRYTPGREWFTREIPLPGDGESTYLTFIVFQPGKFNIGSPADEPDRLPSETKHPVRITRPYAIADREITGHEIGVFGKLHGVNLKLFPGTESHAGPGLNWYESVRFCRWLSELDGISEEDQAYPAPDAPEVKGTDTVPGLDLKIPSDWPLHLERRGYRLATEDEWEVAARSGVRTQYFYGGDRELLTNYARLGLNSGNASSEPKTRRPNLRGLFDMHGNMFEWVHNWTGPYPSEEVFNWTGPSTGERRVIRGGCYGVTQQFCRNSQRSNMVPTTPFAFIGFRVAITLPSKEELSRGNQLSKNVESMPQLSGER